MQELSSTSIRGIRDFVEPKMLLSQQLLSTNHAPSNAITPLFADPTNADPANNVIANLCNRMNSVDNQLEVQEKSNKKMTKILLSTLMRNLEEVSSDNRALQLNAIDQQRMRTEERMTHHHQTKVLEAELMSHQNEIAKLRQELADTKRQAEERIHRTIKEKEDAVLTLTKTANARVQSVQLAADSRWRSFFHYLDNRRNRNFTELQQTFASYKPDFRNNLTGLALQYHCKCAAGEARNVLLQDIIMHAKPNSGLQFKCPTGNCDITELPKSS